MKQVGVVGGGTMGTGIVYVCALAGMSVYAIEPDDTRATVMRENLERAVAGGMKRGKLDPDGAAALLGCVHRLSSVSETPAGLDLIVETVSERLELKHEVLADISAREPRYIGTNTSALSIDVLASSVDAPERFIGMHFFNPVWSIGLVELVLGERTSAATLEAARAFAGEIGKESLTVRNVPGFATSRLDLIASLEAMRMLESGVASAEDIDRAVVLAYRHPVGPLRLSDIVGLDVRLDIARTLEAAHGERFAPPAILVDMVSQGRLGQKSGQGFFAWNKDD